MKLFTKIMLFLLAITCFINGELYAIYEKPVVPVELNSNIVTKVNNLFDIIYNKRLDKVKYPTQESYISYLDKLSISLGKLKTSYKATDPKYILISYLYSWILNIKNSIEIPNITNDSNIVSSVLDNGTELCENLTTYWSLKICETWKKDIYANINNNCPKLYHVPNYWEMKYIMDSWVKLNLTWEYYINSLYWDIVKVSGYPFNWNPYVLKNWTSLNHGLEYDKYSNMVYWISNTNKRDVLCINDDSLIPKNNTNWTPWCKLENSLIDWLNWKYQNLFWTRKYLFNSEKIKLDSLWNSLAKWNIDYSLSLECVNWVIKKTENIEKVNSCNYWYTLNWNDCLVDSNICNLENLWTFHLTTSKVCSWKSLWEEKIQSNSMIFLNGISGQQSADEIIKGRESNEKKSLYNKYLEMYNNKIWIKVTCNPLKEEVIKNYNYKLSYQCKVEWLFWQ